MLDSTEEDADIMELDDGALEERGNVRDKETLAVHLVQLAGARYQESNDAITDPHILTFYSTRVRVHVHWTFLKTIRSHKRPSK